WEDQGHRNGNDRPRAGQEKGRHPLPLRWLRSLLRSERNQGHLHGNARQRAAHPEQPEPRQQPGIRSVPHRVRRSVRLYEPSEAAVLRHVSARPPESPGCRAPRRLGVTCTTCRTDGRGRHAEAAELSMVENTKFKASYNYAFIDESTKKEVRRKI